MKFYLPVQVQFDSFKKSVQLTFLSILGTDIYEPLVEVVKHADSDTQSLPISVLVIEISNFLLLVTSRRWLMHKGVKRWCAKTKQQSGQQYLSAKTSQPMVNKQFEKDES